METKKNWVNYAELKSRIGMQEVLKHYGVFDKLRPSGANLVGCCPIHQGTSPRQFSVNLERNAFNCFGDCKGGGNIFDFVAKMERVSLHQAAVLLNGWFPAPTVEPKPSKAKPKEAQNEPPSPPRDEEPPQEPTGSPEQPEELINTPLTFELKNLNPGHPFFRERGIAQETVSHFGLGVCSKGIMKNRVAIPIHNAQGELVAYCGRALTDEQIEAEGKYKLPANFHKSLVVYNLHRQKDVCSPLILVESFFSVWKLHQAGITRVVSLMGSSLSDEQARLVIDFVGSSGQILLAFDNDEDGQRCTDDCLVKLGRKVFVKTVVFVPTRKPHQLTAEQIKNFFV